MSDAQSQKAAQPSARRPYQPHLRRWLPLTVALILIALLYFLDDALTTSDIAGYAPKDATLVIASDNLAQAWTALESTNAHRRVMDEAPQFLYDAAMKGRKASGIRWTPQRWRLWFGKRFVFARRLSNPIPLDSIRCRNNRRCGRTPRTLRSSGLRIHRLAGRTLLPLDATIHSGPDHRWLGRYRDSRT